MIRRGEASFAFGYLAYYMAFGVFMPYWSAHLTRLGWSASAIGVVLAIFNTVRIGSPLVGGWLVDRAQERKRVLMVGAGLAALAAVWAGAARAPLAIMVSIALYSLAFTSILPAYDAVVLDQLGSRRSDYGRLRLWGSIGFVVMVLGVGALIERQGDGVIPLALVAGHVLAVFVFLTLPKVGGHAGISTASSGGFRFALEDGATRLLLLIAFLQIASFGAFNGFYTIFLRHYGFSERAISLYWSLGVISEIVMFWLSPRILARVSIGHLLGLSVGLTVLRWLVLALVPESAGWNTVAQVTHAACFGLFQASTVMLAARFAPPGAGGRAQALLSAAGAGLGGIVGSLVAGALYERVGPSAAFLGGAGFALAALVCSRWPSFVARL
jgi:PPP family 3-phenylpropionic acid transporter